MLNPTIAGLRRLRHPLCNLTPLLTHAPEPAEFTAYDHFDQPLRQSGRLLLADAHGLHLLGSGGVAAHQPDKEKPGFVSDLNDGPVKQALAGLSPFLEAPVKILASIECYNLNPNKFETLIHGFLHAQRLTMTLTGRDGKAYNPREWFSVPLDTAREVVRRIIDGSIVQYRMDNTTNRLVKKHAAPTGAKT